jgi:uncharacterized membrane protein
LSKNYPSIKESQEESIKSMMDIPTPHDLTLAHPLIEETIEQSLSIIRPNFHLGWDLFLALLPLLIGWILFRHSRKVPEWLWWPFLGIFLLFLPNAPYVLTDVIHFVEKIRVTPPLPLWALGLLLIEYFLYFSIGMQSFTLSMMIWGRFLKHRGLGWLIFPIELLTLALSAFAIYLGRFDRLNSWNVATDPARVLDQSLHEAQLHHSQEVMIVFLTTLALLFYLTKFTNFFVAWVIRGHPGRNHTQREGTNS